MNIDNQAMKAKYVNPFTDFGFKKIFGEEASKPMLIDFLTNLLPETHIIDLGCINFTKKFGQFLGHFIFFQILYLDVF